MKFAQAPFASAVYNQTLRLREEVLRKPIGMSLRDKDKELDHTEYHLCAMDGETMAGCVSLRPLENGLIKLRQMAVAETHQGQGIGAKLVRFAESFAKKRGFHTIETNARKTAQGFYEKLGYEVMGGEFLEINLVHTLMMRKII